MIDLRQEAYLGRGHRVILRQEELHLEATSLEGRLKNIVDKHITRGGGGEGRGGEGRGGEGRGGEGRGGEGRGGEGRGGEGRGGNA